MKVFYSIVLMLLSVNFFVGCDFSSNSNNENQVMIWHWMSDRQDVFDTLAKKYKDKTGIDVIFELYAPSEVYSQKVQAAAQSSTLPEIYGILAQRRDFSSFVQAGHVANLSDVMNEEDNAWKNKFYPKGLALGEFKESNTYGVNSGIYSVPLDMMSIQMIYNKKIFRKAGLNPEKPRQHGTNGYKWLVKSKN